MNSIQRLKRDQYDYINKYYSYISKWKPYSYRKVKVIIYVNVCAFLIYIFLKLKIRPNTVTFIYGVMGLCGGLFLALPFRAMILIGVAFLYLRPFLDWADGPLARELHQTSITGDILDSYGAYLGWAALWVGIGIYLGRTIDHIFYILSPLLPFLTSIDLYSMARDRFIHHYLSNSELQRYNASYAGKKEQVTIPANAKKSKLVALKRIIDIVFEHNARTIDLICLVLIIEIVFDVHILWVYYLAFLLWQACVFTMRFIILYRGGWAETELEKMRNIVHGRPTV